MLDPSNYDALKQLGRMYINKAEDPETYQKGVNLLKKALKVRLYVYMHTAACDLAYASQFVRQQQVCAKPPNHDKRFGMRMLDALWQKPACADFSSGVKAQSPCVCTYLNVGMHAPAQMNPKDDEVWSSLHKYTRNPFGEIQDKARGRKREKELQANQDDARSGALVTSQPGALDKAPVMVTS